MRWLAMLAAGISRQLAHQSGLMEKLLKQSAVWLFAKATKLGVHRLPGFDRFFLALYAVYKSRLEAGPIDRLHEYMPSGSIAIDVGANVGFFTRRFARWVGDGEVIAIEPEQRNFRALRSALEQDGLSQRVRTLQAAAAATAGPMYLEINPIHPADHKLSRDGTGIAVDAVRLDDLIDNKGPLRPSLIKIDVQGAEMLVLQGAPDILRIARPTLFIELSEGLEIFGSSTSALLEHLATFGYEAYWLMREGPHLKASLEEIRSRTDSGGYTDVLFLPTGVN
jgi:FkbM family methyltransferase